MKKKFFRFACCLAALCGMFAFSGCAELLVSVFNDGSSSSEKSYAEDEWNPSEDASGEQSSSSVNSESEDEGQENSESQGEGESQGDSEIFTPEEPNPQKELLRTETDEIGHKIAHYTDGTKEDLGRVNPIDFTPAAPIHKDGYQYLSTLEKGTGMCAFYEEIYAVACNFHYSSKNVTATGEYYQIADMRFSQHGLTSDEGVSVWRTVCLDYPEFFWWANSLLLGATRLTFLIDPLYAKASDRESTQAAIESMVQSCDEYLDGTTTTVERALTIHDYILQITQYAYKNDGVTPESEMWAHNIAGGAQYGKGVCETYAKTYDYLCGLFAIPCITVTGFAVEDGERFGHAWNVVGIDENWYYVDSTWNDLGERTLTREWFGADPETFVSTHDPFDPKDGFNVNFMFELPTCSQALTPVRAASTDEIKNGTYTQDNAPMYASIQDVSNLISGGVTYESYLYPRTAATSTRAEIVQEGAFLDGISHTEGTLVINGEYQPVHGEYFEISKLVSTHGITFTGDVVFRNLSFTAPSLNLDGNSLITEGSAVELTIEQGIVGGCLIDRTTEWADVDATIDLDVVTAQGNELRILQGGKIARANIASGVLRLNTTLDISIDTLWYAPADERLYIDGALATTKFTVGNIIAGTPADEENGVSAFTPDTVTIFVVYNSTQDYPIISVANKDTTAKIKLSMYSDYNTPNRLGKAFINVGEDIALTDICVYYRLRGTIRELDQSKYQKKENGDVCWK